MKNSYTGIWDAKCINSENQESNFVAIKIRFIQDMEEIYQSNSEIYSNIYETEQAYVVVINELVRFYLWFIQRSSHNSMMKTNQGLQRSGI